MAEGGLYLLPGSTQLHIPAGEVATTGTVQELLTFSAPVSGRFLPDPSVCGSPLQVIGSNDERL